MPKARFGEQTMECSYVERFDLRRFFGKTAIVITTILSAYRHLFWPIAVGPALLSYLGHMHLSEIIPRHNMQFSGFIRRPNAHVVIRIAGMNCGHHSKAHAVIRMHLKADGTCSYHSKSKG